jgi:hypothetical protein
VVSKNLTTRKHVKTTLPPGVLFLDCAAAGLVVNSGDKLKVIINGSEP